MARKKVFSIGTALSQGLEETIELAQSYSGELRIEIIPLRKVELDPTNPRDFALSMHDVESGIHPEDSERKRKLAELESLQSIANSIKSQGIINPIIVYKYGEKYRLIAGERRTLASVIAGKSDIQARILDVKPDALKISLLQWIENVERSDLSLWERLINLEKIVGAYAKSKNRDAREITITELSHLLGCVKSHAMNYKSLLCADDELRKLISQNKINNLKKVSLISEIKVTETRQQALQLCLAGASFEQLKTFVNRITIKPHPQKQIEKRGRQTSSVNFGVTKNIKVAKFIIESLLKQVSSSSHIREVFKDINWNNHRAVSEAFKQLLKSLERIHA